MADYGSKVTDRAISQADKELRKTYQQAKREMQKKLSDFKKRFAAKDKEKRKQRDEGKITEEQYQQWLSGQVFIRHQWESKVEQINQVLLDHNRQAMKLVSEKRFDVFAENYNINAFEAEKRIAISFNVYSAESVAQLMLDDPRLLPEWKIDKKKDYTWNSQKVNNIIRQGIIQGESVDQITDRLCDELSSQNNKKMRMFARTALNSAQNAGRQKQMEDAAEMGIEVKKQWLATLDNRTRDAHRGLDANIVPFNRPFHSSLGDIMFPGDMNAAPANVYNCRCAMRSLYPKYEDENAPDWREDETIDGQTYAEWKQGKKKKGLEK